MKKSIYIILILAAVALAVSGCASSSNNAAESSPVKEITTTVDTTEPPTEDPTTEIVTKQPAEKETEQNTTEIEKVNQLVFEDDKVVVYYSGYEVEDDGDCRIHMRVENKSNTDWEFVLMDTSINNYVIDPIFRVTVPSGKTANEDIFIFDTKLKDNNINNLETIEFKIHYFDTVNKIDEKESYTTTPIKIDL